MTDEGKKPDTDEISEENLGEVSGGATVFGNASGSSSGGSAIPPTDICMTPSGNASIPVPYPNVAGDGDGGTETPVKTKKASSNNS